MASSRRLILPLFLLSYLFIFSSIMSTSASASAEKVSLALYYETLCPYCSRFIVNYLPKIFKNGLIDIVDLKLVPYGNAKVGSDNTITCQHGPYECLLNTVEGCALHIWPELNIHFNFIYCVERLVVEGNYTQWESCFGKLGLDSKPIADCYNTGFGEKLDLQYAAETNALQPPHRYVPWVTVDGEPIYEDYENFTTYVCKAYKGSNVPEVCKELPSRILSKAKENQINQVSYADEIASSSSSTTEPTKIKSPVTSWRRQMKMATSA